MIDIEKLKETLKTSKVSVVFTKKDGSRRLMRCTQNPKITMQPIKETDSKLITVWDLENDGWRSFYPEKVIMWST